MTSRVISFGDVFPTNFSEIMEVGVVGGCLVGLIWTLDLFLVRGRYVCVRVLLQGGPGKRWFNGEGSGRIYV